jgi:hypothetical protein
MRVVSLGSMLCSDLSSIWQSQQGEQLFTRKRQSSNPRANRRLSEGGSLWGSYFPMCPETNFSFYKSENKKRDLATELYLSTKATVF